MSIKVLLVAFLVTVKSDSNLYEIGELDEYGFVKGKIHLAGIENEISSLEIKIEELKNQSEKFFVTSEGYKADCGAETERKKRQTEEISADENDADHTGFREVHTCLIISDSGSINKDDTIEFNFNLVHDEDETETETDLVIPKVRL